MPQTLPQIVYSRQKHSSGAKTMFLTSRIGLKTWFIGLLSSKTMFLASKFMLSA